MKKDIGTAIAITKDVDVAINIKNVVNNAITLTKDCCYNNGIRC